MHQALYRRFRPETFNGVLGQEHIIKILQNQIKNQAVGHAYLFCGTRGTGKTTLARILAKGVNCTASLESHPCGICDNCNAIKDGIFLDVIEIDAASNNGVENIRELRESVKYAPVRGRCKVYIIDEVHMLSTGAFNALLKTLEEPPAYVMFILATTEPQKLPATILSRCMRLDFRRVSENLLVEGMERICKTLDVSITEGALGIIAANSDGSVRDCLSLLDQCITGGEKEIRREDVLKVLGTKGEEAFIEITGMIDRGEIPEALIFLDNLIKDGIEIKQFIRDWIGHYRNLMMIKFIRKPEDILNISEENIERMRDQSVAIDMSEINHNIIQLANTSAETRWSTQPRILLELCMVNLASKGDASGQSRQVFNNANSRPSQTMNPSPKKYENSTDKAEPGNNKNSTDKAEPGNNKNSTDKAEPEQNEKSTDNDELKQAKTVMVDTKPEKKPSKHGDVRREENVVIAEESLSPSDIDLEQLWERILEDGISEKGSLSMLKKGCRPICIKGDCFCLELGNDMSMRYAQDNEELLTRLAEKHSGMKLRIDCTMSGLKKNQFNKKTTEEIAATVGNRLNINVEVK